MSSCSPLGTVPDLPRLHAIDLSTSPIAVGVIGVFLPLVVAALSFGHPVLGVVKAIASTVPLVFWWLMGVVVVILARDEVRVKNQENVLPIVSLTCCTIRANGPKKHVTAKPEIDL